MRALEKRMSKLRRALKLVKRTIDSLSHDLFETFFQIHKIATEFVEKLLSINIQA